MIYIVEIIIFKLTGVSTAAAVAVEDVGKQCVRIYSVACSRLVVCVRASLACSRVNPMSIS